MKCQACNRQLKTAQYVGRYAYGPVCFSRMFPSVKKSRVVIFDRSPVIKDTKTLDLFAPCFFDTMGEADRLEILAKQG